MKKLIIITVIAATVALSSCATTHNDKCCEAIDLCEHTIKKDKQPTLLYNK
jgi:protein involved in sex pheromone biosynthesis